ncbi:MAG: HAMP domain-containing histidine kinase [Symploca sp. SIO2G7]|nr:HAMP domain-containing histidine kinase [Symploca sp. SIO2G7]
MQSGTIASDRLKLVDLTTARPESKSLLQKLLMAIHRGESVQVLARWLSAAVAETFNLQTCQIELYDSNQRTATLIGGSGDSWLGALNQSRTVESVWQLYEPLTSGKSVLVNSENFDNRNTANSLFTWLGCPVLNQANLVSVIWLVSPSSVTFDQARLGELQQIVDCFAIALHQVQLEQTLESQHTEILELRKAKDEFLQLISHELFAPVGNIQLSTQTLENILKDVSWRHVPQRGTVLKVLSLLSQACRRQKQFVDNLITLMFPEYQKASEPVQMNLSDWLSSLLRTFEAQFEQESLTLKTSIPEEPLLIECDITQLERTITELVTNAIKYTPAKKTVTLSVQAKKTAVEIAIANTGVHIPANHLPHVFKKFYRVPELDQRQYGGSGLGLALVKQLVSNLDGTIEAKSTKQKTTFTVRLPR